MANLIFQNVSHFYKKHQALYDVSASLDNGITALIGPNGAGKTTLINSIVGLLQPTQGRIFFDGSDINSLGKNYYKYLGYCPQSPMFYPNYTAQEFLYYMGGIKGIPKSMIKKTVRDLLILVNLEQKMNSKISTFSGGMKQRLGIAQALLNNPSLLILDEPTAGLDPIERIRFRNMLSEISASRIVIIATHIISDIENIANQVLFLKQGHLIVNSSPQAVMTELSDKVWIIPSVGKEDIISFSKKHLISNMRKLSDTHYELKLISSNSPDSTSIKGDATLEDAFLYYFKEKSE